MRILFVGDIFGRPGREAVAHFVPQIRREKQVDFTIGNAENAAGGRGLTGPTAQALFAAGLDVLTLGNHTWDRPETEPLLKDPRVLRPANYAPGVPGRGVGRYDVGGKTLDVVQLMGRHGMDDIDCPFRTADALIKDCQADAVLVDFHAEASSEKQAMGWYLDGRVAAVLGTHTHVQTADERVLPRGTAYIGDIGMAGPRDGVIGGAREGSLKRFLTGIRVRLEVAEGDALFCAVLVDIENGRARSIERIQKIFPRTKT